MKIKLVLRYSKFVSGKKPIRVDVHGDYLADQYLKGETRMLQIGTRPFLVTKQFSSVDTYGKPIGHYHILYASQYLSFKAYYELSLQSDNHMEIHY